MGSNNVVVIDAQGQRLPAVSPIEVGEGPTGLALNDDQELLYVLNKFEATLSIIDTASFTLLNTVALFDPSPAAIKIGRRHLYDTHLNSGLGHIACASCHVDARLDRLAWDLGDPSGAMKAFDQNCQSTFCEDWHPMKGPMTTQTLQDIIGKEPHHWRGDRFGLEEFAGAFKNLQGADQPLPAAEMQEFEDFLATIYFPPNPFRTITNELPTNLPLPGHYSSGVFSPAGQPLPPGNAQSALSVFRPGFPGSLGCANCHTVPIGIGTDGVNSGNTVVPLPPGPDGEHHHVVVAFQGTSNVSIKIPQLRNLYDRVGFETTQLRNLAGFGFLHDGSVDSINRFLTIFSFNSDQKFADMVAFMLSFSGSELPLGSPATPLEPPGTASQDTHAAVGRQTTLIDTVTTTPEQLNFIDTVIALADAEAVGVVVKGTQNGIPRGYAYLGNGWLQSDRAMETVSVGVLESLAAPGSELTFTVVPWGSQMRIGIDRDFDGHFDRDELDGCSNPADPQSIPPMCIGAQPPAADTLRKNRYISFIPNNAATPVAFRVSKLTLPAGTCWVQAPDAMGNARCDANPVFRVWSEPKIHVGDCEIVPIADYEVAATTDGHVFSSATTILTIRTPALNNKLWGDVAGINSGMDWTAPNQVTNVNDVQAILAFIQDAVVKPGLQQANLQAVSSNDPCLNAFVNTADVFIVVKAANGDAYPFTTNPANCPVCP